LRPIKTAVIRFGVVVHGGAGSSIRLSGVCASIATKAFDILERGGPAMDAAVEAVRLLENDGRFNAGGGSIPRLDGRTVEMDATVMDSDGRIGVVMAARDVRNPVLVAKALTETPHIALAGEGASLFAKRIGLGPSLPISERVLSRYAKTRRLIEAGKRRTRDVRWKSSDIEEFWNFNLPYEQAFSTDTVGAVALDDRGAVAVASSTGGASPMLNGRVGDTAMIGCGFYANSPAAVAATGIGEEIMRRMLAKTVYDMIRDGEGIEAACDRGIGLFPGNVPVGLIAISNDGFAVRANRRLAWSSLTRKA
jgi:L-asparaginase / beta-aspartyl-peptidase